MTLSKSACWPRLRAALIHLLLSVLVAFLGAVVIFLVWFPHPFEMLAGGTSLFVLVVSVDVVMGPLLTFVVFTPRKPTATLLRDLAVIGTLQASALIYGLHTLYVSRPVALVLEGRHFRVVTAVDVVSDELPQAPEGLRTLPIWGPRTLRTATPASASERERAMFMALSGADLGSRPMYWRAWDAEGQAEALSVSRPLQVVLDRHRLAVASILPDIVRTGLPVERLRCVPVLSRFAEGVILLNDRGVIVGFTPFDAP